MLLRDGESVCDDAKDQSGVLNPMTEEKGTITLQREMVGVDTVGYCI